MTWKRSKDGGIDYDPKAHEEHQQTFNPYGSAHTFTFDLNQEVLPLPKRSVKERFNDYKKKKGVGLKWRWLKKKKIPVINLETETREVKAEVRSFKVEMPPYKPPTDKEIIEGLEFCDNYEAAYLITSLKKEKAALKGKLTKLTKKSCAYKDDLDRANGAIRQLLNEKHGKTE